jgi:hypothetical protein
MKCNVMKAYGSMDVMLHILNIGIKKCGPLQTPGGFIQSEKTPVSTRQEARLATM